MPTFSGAPSYTYVCQLEGSTYRFVLTYNRRSQSWYLDIGDDNDRAIRTGIRMVNDWPLAKRGRSGRLPPGMFACISLTDDNETAGEFDLGDRVRWIYFDSSDLSTKAMVETVLVGATFVGSCVSDYDCPGPLVCRFGACVSQGVGS